MAGRLRTLATAIPLWLAIAVSAACADREPADTGSQASPAASSASSALRPGPPHARWEVVDMLREAESMPHPPSDGGGRAWLVRDDDQDASARAATPDRFRIVYEAGPHGVTTGGAVYLQVSPFWEWSTPQVGEPTAPGYTEVRATPDDIEFEARSIDRQLLAIIVTGRPLVEGDRLEILYGAGLGKAMTDRYAERDSHFWIGVDGDGDGSRTIIDEPPKIDVRPGPAAGLIVTLPTIARPGETIRITLAFIDVLRNSGMPVDAEVVFTDPPPGLELPASVRFEPEHAGRRSIEVVAREPGIYRISAAAGSVSAASNPLIVSEEGPRVLWGDLHGHSNFSDGTGVPEDYFLYARDVTGLDVVSLTDHDHWGILPLVEHPALWEEIRSQTRRFHDPGRFVTLLGFEWTSWIHGHRHVLYFGDEGRVIDSVDPKTESPEQLWAALEGQPAMTFAHHSAGGPIPTNWDVAPDPHFEPLTEIVSIHGSSEAADSPGVIYSAVEGNFVRDALDRGYRLGFVGSGDSHDGHPGSYSVDPPRGGIAAILAEERTRESVLAALRARRVYATNGPRILLRVALGSYGMGRTIPLAEGERRSEPLFIHVVAAAPLESVELIRSGRVVDGLRTEGRLEVTLSRDLDDLVAGEYVYVRATQENGGTAWSSPIFLGEAPGRPD